MRPPMSIAVPCPSGFGEGREPRMRPLGERGGQRIAGQIERLGRDRLVGRTAGLRGGAGRLRARGVVIGDLREAVLDRLLDEVVEDHRRVGQVVEERLEPLVEERQPVLHAGEAAALAHRLVERIARRHGAEGGPIVLAEAADRLLAQHHLAGRHEVERAGSGRWCAGSPDRRGGSISSVSPKKSSRTGAADARREEVDDAAAHRVLADVADGRRAVEAVRLQPAHQPVHADDCCRLRRPRSAPRRSSRSGTRWMMALAVVRTTRGPCGCREQSVQRAHAPSRHVGIRRDAVVGQAVPGRERHRRQRRREEGERALRRGEAAGIARDEEERAARLGQPRQDAPLQPVGHAAERDAARPAKEIAQRIGDGGAFSGFHGRPGDGRQFCRKAGCRCSGAGGTRPTSHE